MENESKGSILKQLKVRKKIGKDQFVIFILLGILLIVVALPTSGAQEKKSKESGMRDGDSSKIQTEENIKEENGYVAGEIEDDVAEYEKYLENKLEQAISSMDGAGKVKAVVTANTSKESIVEKDMPAARSSTVENDTEGGSRSINEIDSQEETVYIKESDGSTSPYVIKTLQPVIEGVVIVAQGGGNAEVSKNITEVIVALFDIESHKIKVVKMKSE